MSEKDTKKALMVASVPSMIEFFNMDNIALLKKQGYSVSVACHLDNSSAMSNEKKKFFENTLKDQEIELYNIKIPRSILNFGAIFNSIKALKKIIDEEQYLLIHAHSPIGGVVARVAAKFSKCDLRMIYTAHGFHFFKGAPMWQWLLFFPIEWFCGWLTDDLITINQEDYTLAKKWIKHPKIHYINGVGIDTERFQKKTKNHASEMLKLISVGELNSNKNHKLVIEAIARCKNKKIEYVICGKGPVETELEQLVQKYQLGERVRLLGFRDDIPTLLSNSDVFVFPSLREGLPVSVMEAMATGLPILASDIRGNADLVDDNLGGFLFDKNKSDQLSEILVKVANFSEEKLNEMGRYNLKKIQKFDSKVVNQQMDKIYHLDCSKTKQYG